MKRFFKFIMAFSLLLILTLSAVGCNFLVDSGDTTGGGAPITPPSSGSGESSGFSVDVDLKDSVVLSESITYTANSRGSSEYSSVADVIEQTDIYRASVVINVILDGSVINGSGTIIDIDDGIDYGNLEDNIFYILTCHHVIDNCEGMAIKVYVPDTDKRQYDETGYNDDFAFSGKIGGTVDRSQEVSLVGGDLDSDIALLRLYVADDTLASKIVKAKIIDKANPVRLGEEVIAIGNAEGDHPNWTTSGLISDLSSTSMVENIGNMTLWGISADIYPGNSGGGLFDMYGELIGVTNSGESITDANGKTTSKGINFAIPFKTTDDATTDKGFLNVAKQLLATYNEYNYGYVSGRKEKIGMTTLYSNGIIKVSSTTYGGAADLAGVKEGDILTHAKIKSVGTKVALTNNDVLAGLIRAGKCADTLTLYAQRTVNGKTSSLEINIALSQYYFCNTGNYTLVKAS